MSVGLPDAVKTKRRTKRMAKLTGLNSNVFNFSVIDTLFILLTHLSIIIYHEIKEKSRGERNGGEVI